MCCRAPRLRYTSRRPNAVSGTTEMEPPKVRRRFCREGSSRTARRLTPFRMRLTNTADSRWDIAEDTNRVVHRGNACCLRNHCRQQPQTNSLVYVAVLRGIARSALVEPNKFAPSNQQPIETRRGVEKRFDRTHGARPIGSVFGGEAMGHNFNVPQASAQFSLGHEREEHVAVVLQVRRSNNSHSNRHRRISDRNPVEACINGLVTLGKHSKRPPLLDLENTVGLGQRQIVVDNGVSPALQEQIEVRLVVRGCESCAPLIRRAPKRPDGSSGPRLRCRPRGRHRSMSSYPFR